VSAPKTNSTWLAGAAVVLLAALSYFNILQNSFTLDDFGLIVHSRAVREGDWLFLLSTDYWAAFDNRTSGLYRPLTSLFFSLQYSLGNGGPFLFHLSSLLLHALCSLLFWLVVLRLAGTRAALVAGALFAVHPIHSEAVAAVAGQGDLLATLALLLALLIAWTARQKANESGHAKQRYWPYSLGLGLAFALGLLAKEHALVLPALLAGLDYYLCKKGRLRRFIWWDYALCVLISIGYLFLRFAVLGTWSIGYIDPLDNPLAALPLHLRLPDAALVAWRYLALLVLPYKLSADYSYDAVPLSVNLLPLALPALLLLLISLALLLRKFVRRPGLLSLGALWMLAAFAPVANVVLPIGTIMAERLLYLPSLGFCLLVGALFAQIWDRGRQRLSIAITVLLLLCFMGRTLERNGDWRNNETLFASATTTYPRSAKAHAGLGEALLQRGDAIGAIDALQHALDIYPDYAMAHYNTGVAYLSLHQYEQALSAFSEALHLKPRDYRAVLNMGVALWELGRRPEAVAAYEQALRLKPGYAPARENLERALGAGE